MKILLDTHVFIWLIDQDNRLDSIWREEINNSQNQIFLSVASVWECVIKHQIGKLNFPQSPDIYLPQKRKEYRSFALTKETKDGRNLEKRSPKEKIDKRDKTGK